MWQVYAGLAAYQVISGAQQAETIRRNADFNRQLDALNAKYAEIDAWKMEQQGETMAARYQSSVDHVLATQRVAQASQNVDINFGTAAALQAETKLTGFLNQLDIRNQAHAKAMGYKTEARNTLFQGEMRSLQSEAQARATQNAAILGGATTALQGFSGYDTRKKNSSGSNYGSVASSGTDYQFNRPNYLGGS